MVNIKSNLQPDNPQIKPVTGEDKQVTYLSAGLRTEAALAIAPSEREIQPEVQPALTSILQILKSEPYNFLKNNDRSLEALNKLSPERLEEINQLLNRKDVKELLKSEGGIFQEGVTDTKSFISRIARVVKSLDAAKDLGYPDEAKGKDNISLGDRWNVVALASRQLSGDSSRLGINDYMKVIDGLKKEDGISLSDPTDTSRYARVSRGEVHFDALLGLVSNPEKFKTLVDKVTNLYNQTTGKNLSAGQIFKDSEYTLRDVAGMAQLASEKDNEVIKHWLAANQAWLEYSKSVAGNNPAAKFQLIGSTNHYDSEQLKALTEIIDIHRKNPSLTVLSRQRTDPALFDHSKIIKAFEDFIPSNDDLELVINGLKQLEENPKNPIDLYNIYTLTQKQEKGFGGKTDNLIINPLVTVEFLKGLGRDFEQAANPILNLYASYISEEVLQNKQSHKYAIENFVTGSYSNDETEKLAVVNDNATRLLQYKDVIQEYKPIQNRTTPLNHFIDVIQDPLLKDLDTFTRVWNQLKTINETLSERSNGESVLDMPLGRLNITTSEGIKQLDSVLSSSEILNHLNESVDGNFHNINKYFLDELEKINPKESNELSEFKKTMGYFKMYNETGSSPESSVIRANVVLSAHMQLLKLKASQQE